MATRHTSRHRHNVVLPRSLAPHRSKAHQPWHDPTSTWLQGTSLQVYSSITSPRALQGSNSQQFRGPTILRISQNPSRDSVRNSQLKVQQRLSANHQIMHTARGDATSIYVAVVAASEGNRKLVRHHPSALFTPCPPATHSPPSPEAHWSWSRRPTR